jgi:LPS-assembly protein
MSVRVRKGDQNSLPGPAFAGAVKRVFLALATVLLIAAPASAQSLLPAGFLDFIPTPGAGPARVEADVLTYDSRLDLISARGGVKMTYQDYILAADALTYNQRTGELHATGNVVMTDPGGNSFAMDKLEVTGGMKEAFIQSLAITTTDGATIDASDVRYSRELETILTDAAYSPCGLCIDERVAISAGGSKPPA